MKPERVGRGIFSEGDDEEGRSSPRRHWPQKAVAAQVAIAASTGVLRSRFSTSCESILALIGGHGRCFEPPGARLLTPLRM